MRRRLADGQCRRRRARSIRSRPDRPCDGVAARSICCPPRRRAILVLYELEGTPIGEIARLLGVTPVTVRWHLMRARREMARVLGDER